MDSVRCLHQARQGEGTAGGFPQRPWASAWWGGWPRWRREEGGGGRVGGRGAGEGQRELSCLLLASESELQLKS